jgi:hypothetical protein
MVNEELIYVYAYCGAHDSGFTPRIYTKSAFNTFLEDLKTNVNKKNIFNRFSKDREYEVVISEENCKAEFNDPMAGEIILRWEPVEIISEHTPIDTIHFSAGGYDENYLIIQ